MFADMVGYSQRLEEDEERNSRRAARSIEFFEALIGDYGGEIANVSGDGILALFESPDQALDFAVQAQSELRDQAVWGDGGPVQFRVGLNFGEVIVTDHNVIGHSVNVAARLQSLAEPGGILVSSALRAALREEGEISFRPLGPKLLRNILEPIDVFAVTGLRPEAPSPQRALREASPVDTMGLPSITAVALVNLSGEPADDHLCKGIAADIIANLSRFRSLTVIARHSAFLFSLSSTSAREIGRRLGVRYLLGGRLRRAGDRVRIAVELIDTESEGVLWSDRFNVKLDELFDLQDEIAGAVASRLAIQIDLAERRHEAQHPRDIRAYGLVLRGQQLALRFSREANAHARRLFLTAIQLEPDYGRAHSALSRTHNLDWRYSWSTDPEASLDAALALARRAIELDPLDACAHAELAFARLYKKLHDEALAHYVRAMDLNPNDPDIVAEYADALVYAGQPVRSIELLDRAMRLNPHYPDWYLWYLADAYNAMKRPADVIATVRRMHDPSEGRRLLAANFAHLGMMAEAQAEAREILRLHPEFTIASWRGRPPYRDAAILEHYIDGLRKAGLPE